MIYGCKSCNLMLINGVICHETGCPDKNIDWLTGQYIHECRICGYQVLSESRNTYECCEGE